MLSGIEYFKVSDLTGNLEIEIPNIELLISTTDNNLPSPSFQNYFMTFDVSDEDENKFSHLFFLTIKPQIFWTTEKSPSPLLLSMPVIFRDCLCFLAKIYFSSEPPVILCIWKILSIYVNREVESREYIDCSYSRVKAAAVENGLNDSIIAYDIYPVRCTVDGSFSESDAPIIPPQRFILRKGQGDWKSFVFANSIGGVDTVISTGRCKTLMSGDVYAFMNDGVEREQRNDAREQVEVNSGYIDSEALRKLWYEFFKSSDRCVAEPDGTLRNIIVDEYKCEYTVGELSSFTFKYHYAEQQAARLEDRTELDDYYIG